jgi:hypothetical protein
MEKKKCPQCGGEFSPRRWWQEFCCPKHRQDFHNHQYRLAGVGPYAPRDERMNGHAPARLARKLDLAALGFAPKATPITRRKIKPDAEPERQHVVGDARP